MRHACGIRRFFVTIFSCLIACVIFLFFSARTSSANDYAVLRTISYERDNASEWIRLEFDHPVESKSATLDKSTTHNLPARVYIDFFDARLSAKVPSAITPQSTLVQRIRIAQREPTIIRLVCEVSRPLKRSSYNISRDPQSSVVTVIFPITRHLRSATSSRIVKSTSSSRRPAASSSAVNAGRSSSQAVVGMEHADSASQPERSGKSPNRNCIIVIDPGHGGKDPGAIGYNGLQEKDVCLALGLALKKRLERETWCKAILTRSSDVFLSLAQRAKIANDNNADLFISLHTNSHDDQSLRGIETYYLDFSSDDDARRVAARENFTTPEAIGDLEMILFDLLQSSKINTSSILAGYVHNALVGRLTERYASVRNLGVKHAPLRILIDADMPCIIIETAFISNPEDARRLTDLQHQQLLAEAITEGIRGFKTSSAFASYTMNTANF